MAKNTKKTAKKTTAKKPAQKKPSAKKPATKKTTKPTAKKPTTKNTTKTTPKRTSKPAPKKPSAKKTTGKTTTKATPKQKVVYKETTDKVGDVLVNQAGVKFKIVKQEYVKPAGYDDGKLKIRVLTLQRGKESIELSDGSLKFYRDKKVLRRV